jgi:hypothetical protein
LPKIEKQKDFAADYADERRLRQKQKSGQDQKPLKRGGTEGAEERQG